MDIPGQAISQDPALKALLDDAAERGARKALERIGLHDELAGDDVRDLRGLMRDFREARRTFWQTVVRLLATVFLAALVAGAAALIWKAER